MMALNAGTLAVAIEAAWRSGDMIAVYPGTVSGLGPPGGAVSAMCNAIATAIVTHITVAGVVTGTVVDPVSGVLPIVGGKVT